MSARPFEPKGPLFHTWDERPSIDFELMRAMGVKPVVMFAILKAEQRAFPHLRWNGGHPVVRLIPRGSVRDTLVIDPTDRAVP